MAKKKSELLVVVQDQNINVAGTRTVLFDASKKENISFPIKVKGPDDQEQNWSVEIVLTPPELRE